MKYLIDTSSLIDINEWYDIKIPGFVFIWDIIKDKILKNELNSVILVKNELNNDDINKWLKQFKNFYLNPTDNEQDEFGIILEKYPDLIKLKSTKNSDADVFLIAIAKHREYCIVSSERETNSSKQNIPNICRIENIKYIETKDFIKSMLNNN